MEGIDHVDNSHADAGISVSAPKTDTAKQRLRWIDITKGLCMIAVMLGHMREPSMGFVYSFHLTAFFILSGYTMRQEPLSVKYLKNKFHRLMTPYFMTCAAIIAMRLINIPLVNKDYTVSSFTRILYLYIVQTFLGSGGRNDILGVDLGNYHSIGAIWFLPAMFFAVVIVQYILNNIPNKKTQMLTGIIIAMLASLSNLTWMPMSIQASFFAVPFIIFGKFLRDYEILEKIKIRHIILLAAVFAIGCYTEYAQVFYMVDATVKDWLFTVVCAIASSLLIISLSYKIKRLPFIEFIGKNSLIVLCVHMFEMAVLSTYFADFRAYFGIPETKLYLFITRFIFVVILTSLILLYNRTKKKSNMEPVGKSRSLSIDIMRALLIILMIVGHSRYKDAGFSRLVYSFHMMAFVWYLDIFSSPACLY